jgi:hypothetical protein
MTEEKPDEDDAPTVEDGKGNNVVAEDKPQTDLEIKGKTTLQVTKELVIILSMRLPAMKVWCFCPSFHKQ